MINGDPPLIVRSFINPIGIIGLVSAEILQDSPMILMVFNPGVRGSDFPNKTNPVIVDIHRYPVKPRHVTEQLRCLS